MENSRTLQFEAHIHNSPEAVIAYIADVRNRPMFLSMLTSVSDIEGDPSAVGTTWKWTWSALGLEFQGTGRCTAHEPGRLYSMESEGGIRSAWTYRAAPDGDCTRLTLDLEYQVPERALSVLTEPIAEGMRKNEAEKAIKNLQTILKR